MSYTVPALCTANHSCGRVASLLMYFRDYGVPIALLLVAYLFSENVISAAMIILAQSHFLMAYLYQYRGGKMNRWYILCASILLVVFAAIFAFVEQPLYFLFTIASLLFSIHFVIDEVTLHDETWTDEKAVTIVGFVLFFNAIAFSTLYPGLRWLIIIFSTAVFSYMLVRLVKAHWPSNSERYLWFLSLLFSLYYFFHTTSNLNFLVFFIILLHGINWLLGYGVRMHGHKKEKQYWIETVFFLLLCGVLELVYVVTQTPYLVFFFSFLPYYSWAIAHIVLSAVATMVGKKKILTA